MSGDQDLEPMNLIGRKNIFLSASALLVVAAWVAVLVYGLHPGIDLRGGARWVVAFPQGQVTTEAIRAVLTAPTTGHSFAVKQTADNTFTISLSDISETEHQVYLSLLKTLGALEEEEFASIGPTIGAELKRSAIWAIILVLFGISTYIAWAFRKVSRPIASWKYGLVTLITLFHDVSIPLGLIAFLGVEVNTNIIVSLLVVMGFSVHDTIVVFDRIREKVKTYWNERTPLEEIINRSVRETIVRSINTSLTLVFVLIALMIWGPQSLFFFLLALLVGTVVGTYSSIFVASPLLFLWRDK